MTRNENFKQQQPQLRDLAAGFARGLAARSPSSKRGRRECRAPDAPAAACAGVVVERTRVSQVTPETPGIPRAMVYGLFRALPGDRAFLSPSPAEMAPANLTPASRRQDHTTSPSASRRSSKARSASTASRPASVTIAQRPSLGRDGRGDRSDLRLLKIGIFLQRGLDRFLVICPSGQP